jgi:hypothetical protein
MSRIIDLTGQKYGRLTVIKKAEKSENGRAFWHCRCECGNEKTVLGKDLRSGNSKSCGCLKKELMSSRMTTHGCTNTRLYNIWYSMKQRCENPSTEKSRMNYKNRGITICPEWHDISSFQEWALSNGYTKELTIDRKNNDKGYYPENCRWVDNKTQANNRRSCRNITFNGETHTIAQWAERLGMSYNVLDNRLLYLGWDIEKALTIPVKKRRIA